MKYTKNFERDFKWYIYARHHFRFSGRHLEEVEYDKEGADGKKAFFIYDTHGKLVPTKHTNILQILINTKASANLHIKMYAQSRAEGSLPKILFISEICEPLCAPPWFRIAVEQQKRKYYRDYI